MKYRLQMSGEGTQHPGFDGNLAGTVGVADDGKTFTVEAPNVIAAAPSPPPEGVVPGATGMSARDMALAADRSAPATRQDFGALAGTP